MINCMLSEKSNHVHSSGTSAQGCRLTCVQWTLEQADRLGLESFFEAMEGMVCYERFELRLLEGMSCVFRGTRIGGGRSLRSGALLSCGGVCIGLGKRDIDGAVGYLVTTNNHVRLMVIPY